MKTTTGLAQDDVGDREPALVFLPGWCASRDAFRPLYPHLARRALAVDWRGHGGSSPAAGDFGTRELVDDAVAAIEASGAHRVIPAAVAHAGWVAIELRRRLGPARVPGIVLIDWMVLGAPPPFHAALASLQRADTWEATRARLFAMWTTGIDAPALHAYVRAMGGHGFEMWARAGREIAAAFAAQPVPLGAIAELAPPPPTLHVYAQPADPAFLAAQERFAAEHAWFSVRRVAASSHFPMFEAPGELAAELERFASERA
ncbi:MAG: alpha/beta fold hydrolase [Acidobacteriota bacterium]